jgi:hypothetical protein
MKFNPPINKRTTDQLLEIIESADDWNPDAVVLAQTELIHRNVTFNKIKDVLNFGLRKEKIETLRKANLSYNIVDFIPIPFIYKYGEVLEILFSWGLKKDGYYRKAKQQKYFRITLGIIIAVVIMVNKLLE